MSGAGSSDLAWLDGFAREHLGPGFSIGTIAFEGRMLVLEGARIPLGVGDLHVARAAIELGAGAPLGAVPLAARLVSLRGAIHALGAVVPVDFASSEAATPSWIDGTLRAGDAIVTASVKPRDGGARDVAIDLVIATSRSRITVAGTVDRASQIDGRIAGRLDLDDALRLAQATGVSRSVRATIDLDLVAAGPISDPTIRGSAFAAQVSLAHEAQPICRLDSVAALLHLDRRELRYRDLAGRARTARFGGWGRLPLAPPSTSGGDIPLLALGIDRGDAVLACELAALAGVALRVGGARSTNGTRIPDDLTFAGEIMIGASSALSGAFAIETSRSAIALKLATSPAGALLGSTLRGRVAASDAAIAGLLPNEVRPRSGDAYAIDARLSGTLARPGMSGRMSTAASAVDIDGALVVLEGVSALFDVDASRIAWHGFSARFYGGELASSGSMTSDGDAIEATASWSGVRLETVPTNAAGERALASILHGVASGEVRIERVGLVDGTIGARGRVTVADASYPFVRDFTPTLERYGLPAIRPSGSAPFTASLRVERGAIVVDPLSAALDGIAIDGALRIGFDASLDGEVRVHLHERYLARSPWLALPAAMARTITVPVRVRGTVSAPAIETNAIEILDGLVKRSRVGGVVKSVVDDVLKLARPHGRKR